MLQSSTASGSKLSAPHCNLCNNMYLQHSTIVHLHTNLNVFQMHFGVSSSFVFYLIRSFFQAFDYNCWKCISE